MKKEEKKKKTSKTAWGCLTLIIFIIIVSIGMWFYAPFLQESYKKAEIDAAIRLFEPKYLEISEKYMTFRLMKYILKPDSSMLCTATEYCYLFT